MHNKPFLMHMLAMACLLLWGMLATIIPSIWTNQTAIGVAVINSVLLLASNLPFLKILYLNYSIERHFKYIVTKPLTQSPCSHVERVCLQHFESWASLNLIDLTKTSHDKVEMKNSDVFQLCADAWPEAMTTAIAENDWPAPTKHRSSNKPYQVKLCS